MAAVEQHDGHGRCIVGAGAASSWTLSRKLSLYWLAGARLEAASCKESGGESSGEAGGGGVLGRRKGERRMGLIRWRLARREGDGLGRFGSHPPV
jgi:hypothetical protein